MMRSSPSRSASSPAVMGGMGRSGREMRLIPFERVIRFLSNAPTSPGYVSGVIDSSSRGSVTVSRQLRPARAASESFSFTWAISSLPSKGRADAKASLSSPSLTDQSRGISSVPNG
ncbi:hypothetical protein DRP77_12265 [Candidatus Poribacteria bacterium]|nr:MAG: hypothetical protein DRP77_12265 [Candidatus Poribacteria bacterium]